MLGPRQEVARERRRQMQVRGAFVAGLQHGGSAQRMTFLLACADYLLFALDRLYAQDRLLGELLRERLAPGESEARAQVAEVTARLDAGRARVEALRRLADELRRDGLRGLPRFEAGAREFTASFDNEMKAHRNPLSLHTDRLLLEPDWERVAGVTPESLAREEQLFAAVRASAPPGADPELFNVARRPDAPAPQPIH